MPYRFFGVKGELGNTRDLDRLARVLQDSHNLAHLQIRPQEGGILPGTIRDIVPCKHSIVPWRQVLKQKLSHFVSYSRSVQICTKYAALPFWNEDDSRRRNGLSAAAEDAAVDASGIV